MPAINFVSTHADDGTIEPHARAIFARRHEDGTFHLVTTDKGMPVTILSNEFPTVYPVGSEYSAHHEHAEGIRLDSASVLQLGIEVEGGYQICTPAYSFLFAVHTEEEALDAFARNAGHRDYAEVAATLGKTVDEAKADLVITRI
jgi:hypothetical protein